MEKDMSTKEFGGTSTNTDAADTGVRKSSVEAKNVSSCNNVGEMERDMSTNESGGTITDTDGADTGVKKTFAGATDPDGVNPDAKVRPGEATYTRANTDSTLIPEHSWQRPGAYFVPSPFGPPRPEPRPPQILYGQPVIDDAFVVEDVPEERTEDDIFTSVKNWLIKACVPVLLALSLSAIVTLVITTPWRNSNFQALDTIQSSLPTLIPSVLPSPTLTNLSMRLDSREELIKIISTARISDKNDLLNDSTPQGKEMSWMRETDDLVSTLIKVNMAEACGIIVLEVLVTLGVAAFAFIRTSWFILTSFVVAVALSPCHCPP
mmetsp:Transcript_51020/g.61455  ORF Transcript_51020/g.61455 Transcript_51020/m.61455 type:complete len:321 (-) Transcript_51020:358-1320(-)